MATTSALSGSKGIFPLIAPDTDDRDYNKLARTVTGAGGGKRSALVPIANDPESLETICQTKIDFDDAAQDEQLRLNTAALKFQYFRMCLRDQVRVDWDNARDGKAIDDNGFNAAIADFFATYFLPTDLGDQIFWLQRQIMPKGVSVTAFVSRVKQINKFLSLLPGANGEVPFDDDPGNAKPTLKSVLYEMMPHEWKTKFLDNDNDITDAGYTTARLERFMKVREKAEEVKQVVHDYSSRERGRSNKKSRSYTKGSVGHSDGKVSKNYSGNAGPPGGRGNNLFKGKDYATVKAGNFNCPWHGSGHKWNSCFGNPDSSKYRAGFPLRTPAEKKRERDSHMADEESPKKKSKNSPKKGKSSKKDAHFVDQIRVLGGNDSSSDSDDSY